MQNLSEEEKKAIEYVETQIKYFEEQIKFINATNSDYYDEELEMYENRVRQFNTVLNIIKKQNKELEIKEKMIDELVKYMASGKCYYGGEEEIREVFRKKVEEKC